MLRCAVVIFQRIHLPAALLACAAAASLAGCGGDDSEAGPSGKVSVAAAFAPLAEAARAIGGDRVAVTDLTPVGGQPHDLLPAPGAVKALRSARVVITLGGGFQPAVTDAVAKLPPRTIQVDGIAGQTLLPAPTAISGAPGPLEGVGSAADGQDPHVWVDPARFMQIATAIQAALIKADPGGRAGYEQRGARYLATLRALDTEYATRLGSCDRKVILTTHPAYGYLAEHFGLQQAVTAGISPAAEPSPKALAAARRYARAQSVGTLFFSAPVPKRLARQIKAGIGTASAVLNPVEGLTQDAIDRGDGYVSIMRENLASLQEALGCQAGT